MKTELTSNNMDTIETLKPADAKIAEVNPGDAQQLAQEAMAADAALKMETESEKVENERALDDVRKVMPAEKIDTQKEEESRQRRRDYIQAGIKLIEDALEIKLNKGFIGRGFVSKEELANSLEDVKTRQKNSELNGEAELIDWKVFVRQVKFLDDKKILEQLEALKGDYLKPEDLEKLNPKGEQIENQLTSSSTGVSGDRVQF